MAKGNTIVQGILSKSVPANNAETGYQSEKGAKVIGNDGGSFRIESSIITDDKFSKINENLSKIYDRAENKLSKIKIFDERISDEETEIRNYSEMIETRKQNLEMVRNAAAQMQAQYDETVSLMEAVINIKNIYEDQLKKETLKAETLEKELERSNKRTYGAFKARKEAELSNLSSEKDDEIATLKQRILELEKENKKLRKTEYIGTSKNNRDGVRFGNDCLDTRSSVLYKDLSNVKGDIFLLKYSIFDSNKKERIVLKRLVFRSQKKFGDGLQMQLFDLHSGTALEMAVKAAIIEEYEEHPDLLDDEKLSKFFDKIAKFGETKRAMTFDMKYMALFGTNGIFTPVETEKLVNFKLCEVK